MLMKKLTTLALAGATALTLAATGAAAQPYAYGRDHNDRNWVSINQRQAQLDRRIDQGIRRGDLTWREARRLKREMRVLARLEARYRYGGLSWQERADLDRRFDRLSAQIRFERHDRQQYGYGYRH
jgi:hypothetical protein